MKPNGDVIDLTSDEEDNIISAARNVMNSSRFVSGSLMSPPTSFDSFLPRQSPNKLATFQPIFDHNSSNPDPRLLLSTNTNLGTSVTFPRNKAPHSLPPTNNSILSPKMSPSLTPVPSSIDVLKSTSTSFIPTPSNNITNGSSSAATASGSKLVRPRFKQTPPRSEEKRPNPTVYSGNGGKLMPSFRRSHSGAQDNPSRIPFHDYFYLDETDAAMKHIVEAFKQDASSSCVSIRCPICKLGFSNVELILHLIRHFKTNLNVTADAACLTQCMLCLRDYRMPYKLQLHSSRCLAEASAMDHRECLICEMDFVNDWEMGIHFRDCHRPRDMPYNCPVCFSYRSSFYHKFREHFSTFHGNTNHLYCPYCLKYFSVETGASSATGRTKAPSIFIRHLKQHIDGPNHACQSCRLVFTNVNDMRHHRSLYHRGKSFCLKSQIVQQSLNACRTSFDLEKVKFFCDLVATKHHNCYECGEKFRSFRRHYKLYRRCPECRFGTCCNYAYIRHRRLFHELNHKPVTLMAEVSKYVPEIYQNFLRCCCGFASILGNQIAEHLLRCRASYVVVYPSRFPQPDSDSVVVRRTRKRRASLTNGGGNSDELTKDDFLDMVGLAPCVRKSKK